MNKNFCLSDFAAVFIQELIDTGVVDETCDSLTLNLCIDQDQITPKTAREIARQLSEIKSPQTKEIPEPQDPLENMIQMAMREAIDHQPETPETPDQPETAPAEPKCSAEDTAKQRFEDLIRMVMQQTAGNRQPKQPETPPAAPRLCTERDIINAIRHHVCHVALETELVLERLKNTGCMTERIRKTLIGRYQMFGEDINEIARLLNSDRISIDARHELFNLQHKCSSVRNCLRILCQL